MTDDNDQHFNNQSLVAVPSHVWLMAHSLRGLHLDHNCLTSLPSAIGTLTHLEKLSLHDNQLSELPHEIGCLVLLRELRVDRNRLSYLPDTVTRCVSLEVLHIDGNPICALPHALGDIPALYDLGVGVCPSLTSLPHSLSKLKNLAVWVLRPTAIEGIPDDVLFDPSVGAISAFLGKQV